MLKRCLDVNPNTRITMEELDNHPWISINLLAPSPKSKIEKQLTYEMDEIKEEPTFKEIGNKAPGSSPYLKKFNKLGSKSNLLSPMHAKLGMNRNKSKEKEKKKFR